jgi:hypothetical protein
MRKILGLNLQGFYRFAFYSMVFLFLLFGLNHTAFADSGYAAVPSGSLDPNSGNDPWAIFQLMVSVGTEIWYVIKIVLLISGILGLLFIILGLLKIRASALDSQSGGSHLKHGIILVILGGLMFGAPTLMEMSGYSLFGSAPAPIATNGSVNCQMVNGQYSEGCGNPCPAGASQSGDGSGVCMCPAGNQMNGSMTACVVCPAGQGNSKVGGVCQSCDPNSGQASSNGACITCPAGSGPMNGICQTCSNGTGNSSSTVGICVNCNPPNGPGNEGTSSGQCVQCAQGYGPGGPWAASQAGTCLLCPFNEGWGYAGGVLGKCVICKQNSPLVFADSSGMCVANCPSGTGDNSSGGCVSCNAGSYSNGNVCVPCAAGTFSNAAGASSCSTCQTSDYGNQVGCPCGTGSKAKYSTGNPPYPGCPSTTWSYTFTGVCSASNNSQYPDDVQDTYNSSDPSEPIYLPIPPGCSWSTGNTIICPTQGAMTGCTTKTGSVPQTDCCPVGVAVTPI